MKNKESIIIAIVIILGIFSCNEIIKLKEINKEKEVVIYQLENSISNLENRNDSILNLYFTKKEKIEIIHERIKKTNPDATWQFAEKMYEVMEHFKLNKNPETINYLISQILVESGGQQYYNTKHPKAGTLVVSHAGAIGIGQIMPRTCFHFLKNIITSDDSLDLIKLGSEPFEFVNKYDRFDWNYRLQYESTKWLKNRTNNIILWGYIMRYLLNATGDNLYYSFIAYNAGEGFLYEYLKKGNSPFSHEYIIMIQKKQLNAKKYITMMKK